MSAIHTAVDRLKNENNHIASRDDISSFVEKGGKIPVLMMTCNRAELLKQTLASLFSVKGSRKLTWLFCRTGKTRKFLLLLGSMACDSSSTTHLLPSRAPMAPRALPCIINMRYQRIELFPAAPAMIIVEDDLLFSLIF